MGILYLCFFRKDKRVPWVTRAIARFVTSHLEQLAVDSDGSELPICATPLENKPQKMARKRASTKLQVSEGPNTRTRRLSWLPTVAKIVGNDAALAHVVTRWCLPMQSSWRGLAAFPSFWTSFSCCRVGTLQFWASFGTFFCLLVCLLFDNPYFLTRSFLLLHP